MAEPHSSEPLHPVTLIVRRWPARFLTPELETDDCLPDLLLIDEWQKAFGCLQIEDGPDTDVFPDVTVGPLQ
jgi:hypothetical protein